MRFKRRAKLEFGLQPIDIAPLIDVIFLLSIFLIFSSSFTLQAGANVKLPKAVTSDILKGENLIITITGEDVIYLNGKITTSKDLKNALGKINIKTHTILIKADQRASVGRIVDIWNLCRNLGIEKINIATN